MLRKMWPHEFQQNLVHFYHRPGSDHHQKRKHVALVAQDLGCNPLTVRKWIGRWNKAIPAILEKWDSKSFNREKAILATLQPELSDSRG